VTNAARTVTVPTSTVPDLVFSIDLAAAVLRQASFIEKMAGLGWTSSNGDEGQLVRSVARYHAFLDLMTANPGSFFVPTLVSCPQIPSVIPL